MKKKYLSSRLMRDIRKGGIVLAPRRSGKTIAIAKLMKKDPSYVLVAFSSPAAAEMRYQLHRMLKMDRDALDKRVLAPIPPMMGGLADKKVIIDEFFFNPAFGKIDCHCAIGTAPRDMAVYDHRGNRLSAKHASYGWGSRRKLYDAN